MWELFVPVAVLQMQWPPPAVRLIGQMAFRPHQLARLLVASAEWQDALEDMRHSGREEHDCYSFLALWFQTCVLGNLGQMERMREDERDVSEMKGRDATSNCNDTNTLAQVEATQTASGGDEENEDVEGRYENRHYRNSIDNG